MSKFIGRVYESLKRIYRPRYAVLNAAAAIAYYFLFSFLIRYQNYGILLVNVPAYLEYSMIATASVLLTISVYSIRNTRRNHARFTASSASAASLLFGGMFGGCGCAAPLIMGLATLGISSSSLFSVNALIAVYSPSLHPVIVL